MNFCFCAKGMCVSFFLSVNISICLDLCSANQEVSSPPPPPPPPPLISHTTQQLARTHTHKKIKKRTGQTYIRVCCCSREKKVFYFISLLSKSQTLSCVLYAQEKKRRRRHLTLQIINSHTGIRRIFFLFRNVRGGERWRHV